MCDKKNISTKLWIVTVAPFEQFLSKVKLIERSVFSHAKSNSSLIQFNGWYSAFWQTTICSDDRQDVLNELSIREVPH
jgi:hypothetical protein